MVIDTMGTGGLSSQASTNQRPSCPDAFHDYLASDKTLKSMPIIGTDSTKEADVIATRLVDAPVLAAEGEKVPLPPIVVIELKRPMHDDASEDKDPIQQCLDYVKRVRDGWVRTASGRPIPKTFEPPAFCFVVADLTPKMVDRCECLDGSGDWDRHVSHHRGGHEPGGGMDPPPRLLEVERFAVRGARPPRRQARHAQGKSDAIDAVVAARTVLGTATTNSSALGPRA